ALRPCADTVAPLAAAGRTVGAVRANRRCVQFLLGEGEAAPERVQAFLELGQMLTWHQVDSREPLQCLQTPVMHKPGLALILVYAQPGLVVQLQIRLDIGLLKISKPAQRLLTECGSRSLAGIVDLYEYLAACRFHALDPYMIRR